MRRVCCASKLPDWCCVQARPAYFARLACPSKRLMSPISAIIPAENTFPMPGTDVKVLGMFSNWRSISLSSALICVWIARMDEIDMDSTWFTESLTVLGKRYEPRAAACTSLAISSGRGERFFPFSAMKTASSSTSMFAISSGVSNSSKTANGAAP